MSDDPYSAEAARLRSLVQEQLRQGIEPTLLPYEQLLLLGWYERELARLAVVEEQRDLLAGTVDRNYAERLEAERRSFQAVQALERATPGHRAAPRGQWNERTASELDDHEP